MPVKNVECQLAEMQIGRFVSGDSLSAEAIRQLDAHVAVCPSCRQVLSERRRALKSMLAEGYAAVTTDFPSSKKENLLIKALAEKATTNTSTPPRRTSVEASPEQAAAKPKWNPASMLGQTSPSRNDSKTASLSKSILYAAALGVVLFFMGYLSHGQGSLLGDSAASNYPSSSPQVPQPSEASTSSATLTPAKTTAIPKVGHQATSNHLKPASKLTGSGKSHTKPIEKDPYTESNSDGDNQNTSKDVSEPQRTLAKADVHHPRKYVSAAHKRHHPTRRPVRPKQESRHRSSKKATHHAWGVKIYDEDGGQVRSQP